MDASRDKLTRITDFGVEVTAGQFDVSKGGANGLRGTGVEARVSPVCLRFRLSPCSVQSAALLCYLRLRSVDGELLGRSPWEFLLGKKGKSEDQWIRLNPSAKKKRSQLRPYTIMYWLYYYLLILRRSWTSTRPKWTWMAGLCRLAIPSGNVLTYSHSRPRHCVLRCYPPWQNAATLLRAARTQEMFAKIFRNIFVSRTQNLYDYPLQMLRAWQNESTFEKLGPWRAAKWGHTVAATLLIATGRDHVAMFCRFVGLDVAATMCPRFSGAQERQTAMTVQRKFCSIESCDFCHWGVLFLAHGLRRAAIFVWKPRRVKVCAANQSQRRRPFPLSEGADWNSA